MARLETYEKEAILSGWKLAASIKKARILAARKIAFLVEQISKVCYKLESSCLPYLVSAAGVSAAS